MLKQLFIILVLSYSVHLNSFAQSRKIEFKPVKVPETEVEKRSILVSDSVTVNGKSYNINYHTILRSGTVMGEHIFGQLTNSQGQPLTAQDGKAIISNRNDFSSLIPVDDKLFMISHFETVPGAMYLT
ncbi:MAG: phosphatase, partial [Pseudomonadota bacterium]|nr:phosphatase [Pseudomonadota bacterium]